MLLADDGTAAAPSAAPGPASLPADLLPHDLSPWHMFLNADIVVQAVLVGLAFASVATWTVWLAKTLELAAARRKTVSVLRDLVAVTSLNEISLAFKGGTDAASLLVAAAASEMALSGHLAADGVKERIGLSFERIEARARQQIVRGIGVLATIGATAPFVGLFGTVWGIMNSFVGISRAHTTNLAVVAPGIAEALLATAVGLVAAIPAVVIYNQFARSTAGYASLLADVSAEAMRLVSRDLDQRSAGRLLKAAE